MTEIIYPQFGRKVWSDGIYTLLLHLRGTAKEASRGSPENPTYYAAFDHLMENLSLFHYGPLPPVKDICVEEETPEEVTKRESEQVTRHRHLTEVLTTAEHYHNDQPHPFDLERCHMSLLRPWPAPESAVEKDLWWRLEVMSWYEDWPVMSTSPKDGPVVVKKATMALIQELVDAEMADPRRRDRIVHLFKKCKLTYKDYRELRKLNKEAGR